MATGLLAALALVVALLAGGSAGGLLALGGLGSAFVSAFLIGAQVHSPRRNTHSGGHVPPQRATHCGPGAGRKAASAPSAEPLPTPASLGGAATLDAPLFQPPPAITAGYLTPEARQQWITHLTTQPFTGACIMFTVLAQA